MNRNIIIISFLTTVAFAYSCIRDNLYEQVVPELINVVSGADIAFKAIGGEGDIVIEETGEPLIVTTAQSDWCHLTVEGNKIHVVADEHIGLESRYAVLNMSSGAKSGKTIVHQFGIIVKSFNPTNLAFKNQADEAAIPYNANETIIKATTEADWITISNDPDALRIRVSENVEKVYREATVKWNIGQMNGEFSVTQFDLADAGLLGEGWTWHGKQTGNNRDFPMSAKLGEDEDGYTLTLTYSTSSININLLVKPVVLDRNYLMIPLGQGVGTYATRTVTYQAFTMMASGNARLEFKDAVTEGYLPMLLESAEGKWKATAVTDDYPNMFFRFEMWGDEKHEGTSSSGLILKDIYLTQ